jgi:hypothetical protein
MELLHRFHHACRVRTPIRAVLALALVAIANAATAQEVSFAEREAVWRVYLGSRRFSFRDGGSELMDSIQRFEGPCQLHLIRDSNQEPELALSLVAGDKTLLTLPCHTGSSFAMANGAMYFAQFGHSHAGCKLRAFDMTTGEELWITEELNGLGGFGHSGYSNYVQVRASFSSAVEGEPAGSALIVTGHEGYGDYITIVDAATGRILANRVYRKGFERPKW